MPSHVKTVGIIHMVIGGLGLAAGLGFMIMWFAMWQAMTGGQKEVDGGVAAIVASMGAFLGVLLLMIALPSFLGGWGVMRYKNWARWLVVIMSCLHCVNFPIGTCLGAYSLWVLMSSRTQLLFMERGRGPDWGGPAPPPGYY